jgi:hypothetical protein
MAAGNAFGAAGRLKTRSGELTIYRLQELVNRKVGPIETLP